METIRLERKKVYDGLLRMIHAGIGLSIVMLASTAWLSEIFEKGPGEKTVWMLHIYAGYVLVVSILARAAWGLVGPRHARLGDLWHPRAWRNPIRAMKSGVRRFGHDPLASAAYLALYGMLAVMTVTGLALAAVEHGAGPLTPWLFDRTGLEDLFEGPHEIMFFGVLAFIVVHIGAILLHEWKEGVPIAQEMVSGYQYKKIDPNKEESTHGTTDEK